jgi:hypothetical protein
MWWENDGSQTFTPHMVDSVFDGAHIVTAIDLDQDDDVDIIATARIAHDIAWYENDGSESFTKHIVTDSYLWPTFVDPVDVDDDDDIDIVSAAYSANDISWWENDGDENFTKQTVDNAYYGAIPVSAADMDSDNDIDIIAAAYTLNDITWWESDLTGIDDSGSGHLNFRLPASVVSNPMFLEMGSNDQLLDALGRQVERSDLKTGIYFIKKDTAIQKIVMIR